MPDSSDRQLRGTNARFVVEFYSHENQYHWEETGTFKTEALAMQHYEMKRKSFPKSRWRVTCVELIASSNPAAG